MALLDCFNLLVSRLNSYLLVPSKNAFKFDYSCIFPKQRPDGAHYLQHLTNPEPGLVTSAPLDRHLLIPELGSSLRVKMICELFPEQNTEESHSVD